MLETRSILNARQLMDENFKREYKCIKTLAETNGWVKNLCERIKKLNLKKKT